MSQNDVAAQLMNDMEPHLLSFLRDKVSTFVRWDIVRFFHDNPHTADTATNIASYMGREVSTIEEDLSGLVDALVLDANVVSGHRIYSLSEDAEIRGLVDEFVRACDDRQFRVKAIYHVIRQMR